MQTVVLYGNSLVVSTIGATLQECPDLQVVHVDAERADAAAWVSALDPAAVIFDRASARPDFALSLLEAHPRTLVIGVDLNGGQMLLLSGQQAHIVTTTELVQVIVENSADYLANRSLKH